MTPGTTMGVFHGDHIALELAALVPLKKKQEIRNLITANDGVISFIVTRKCKLLVTLYDEEKAKDSFKCRTAQKYNIPVVESQYIFDCVKTGRLVDPEPYLLLASSKSQLLTSGVIAAARGKTSTSKSKKTSTAQNLSMVKVWKLPDNNVPFFPEDAYEVVRSIQLTKPEKKLFFVTEVHVATVANDFKYRIFTHSGVLTTKVESSKEEGADDITGKQECRFSNSPDETLAIYSRLCQHQMELPNNFTKTRNYLGRNIGSKKFQQMQLETLINTRGPDKDVSQLVEIIWKEAIDELKEILSVSVDGIAAEQVEKAESVLLELKRLLDSKDSSDENEIKKLSDEFYSHLPHNSIHQLTINSKHLISKKQELCQLIRDMVSVSEGTSWSKRCPTESKYRALRCHIASLKKESPEYERIKDLVLSSQQGTAVVKVEAIYEVSRSIEELTFASHMENKKLLFHSSPVHNFVGILSRGLLLPRVIVDDYGGSRTDAGMLGYGIYFADDASTSAKYSSPSKCRGSRLMLVNEVALGRCLEVYKHNTELQKPPEGYDSVHGVKASNDVTSQFHDDEYTVYNTNQQRLQYLVEFRIETDVIKFSPKLLEQLATISVDHPPVPSEDTTTVDIELSDIQNIQDPLSKVKAGLVSKSDQPVPLTEVHIKAKLLDLAAQVIVFQHYRNENNTPIEAKYVFPLDEMAAVCGFEAFINDKHIVGEVKEKEKAHREYREAIREGHGAYLMDQDEETPDVFTVSVGNLPAHCDVLIKITYVAELLLEEEKVSFRIPACVAPWKKAAGLGVETQDKVDTVNVTSDRIKTSVQVAIEMPFEIRRIESPTHRIRMKRTDTKAVVEMRKNQPIHDGFQLLISLAEIHVPRMWVEQLPDDPDNRACMLTFYPEFEAETYDGFEVIFLLDLSNSMKGRTLTEAKKILLLALHHLPESCSFNVIVFGTDYDQLFPYSKTKTEVNAQLAEKFIKNQEATMGNTEVIQPLSSLFLLCPLDILTNIFLVSDGHIANEKAALNAVQNSSGQIRLFTFGVGSVANHHLLRNLSRAGCGYYEYFNSKLKSRWETKIKNQLAKASQPSLSSIRVEWRNFNNMEPPVQAPAQVMALFNGCRQVVYGYVSDCTQATLKAVIDNQEVSTMVSTHELNITTGNILHQLTARAIIQDWTDGQLATERLEHEILKKNRKNYIIKLSTKYSIITQFTSFVAVEKREEGETVSALRNWDQLIDRDSVDILNYMGWEANRCKINVKTPDESTISLDVDLSEDVRSVREKVSQVIGEGFDLSLEPSSSKFDLHGTLWDLNIDDGSTLCATKELMDLSFYKSKVLLCSGLRHRTVGSSRMAKTSSEAHYDFDSSFHVEPASKKSFYSAHSLSMKSAAPVRAQMEEDDGDERDFLQSLHSARPCSAMISNFEVTPMDLDHLMSPDDDEEDDYDDFILDEDYECVDASAELDGTSPLRTSYDAYRSLLKEDEAVDRMEMESEDLMLSSSSPDKDVKESAPRRTQLLSERSALIGETVRSVRERCRAAVLESELEELDDSVSGDGTTLSFGSTLAASGSGLRSMQPLSFKARGSTGQIDSFRGLQSDPATAVSVGDPFVMTSGVDDNVPGRTVTSGLFGQAPQTLAAFKVSDSAPSTDVQTGFAAQMYGNAVQSSFSAPLADMKTGFAAKIPGEPVFQSGSSVTSADMAIGFGGGATFGSGRETASSFGFRGPSFGKRSSVAASALHDRALPASFGVSDEAAFTPVTSSRFGVLPNFKVPLARPAPIFHQQMLRSNASAELAFIQESSAPSADAGTGLFAKKYGQGHFNGFGIAPSTDVATGFGGGAAFGGPPAGDRILQLHEKELRERDEHTIPTDSALTQEITVHESVQPFEQSQLLPAASSRGIFSSGGARRHRKVEEYVDLAELDERADVLESGIEPMGKMQLESMRRAPLYAVEKADQLDSGCVSVPPPPPPVPPRSAAHAAAYAAAAPVRRSFARSNTAYSRPPQPPAAFVNTRPLPPPPVAPLPAEHAPGAALSTVPAAPPPPPPVASYLVAHAPAAYDRRPTAKRAPPPPVAPLPVGGADGAARSHHVAYFAPPPPLPSSLPPPPPPPPSSGFHSTWDSLSAGSVLMDDRAGLMSAELSMPPEFREFSNERRLTNYFSQSFHDQPHHPPYIASSAAAPSPSYSPVSPAHEALEGLSELTSNLDDSAMSVQLDPICMKQKRSARSGLLMELSGGPPPSVPRPLRRSPHAAGAERGIGIIRKDKCMKMKVTDFVEPVVPAVLKSVPRSIGIATYGNIMTTVFKRNTSIPTTQKLLLTTCCDYQTGANICVYEGEHTTTIFNKLLGYVQLTGLVPMLRGRVKIQATFDILEDDFLNVTVVEEMSQQRKEFMFQIERGSDEEMAGDAEMMEQEEEFDHAKVSSGGMWDVCIYEPVELMEPDFREDIHGCAESVNISRGKVEWKTETWNKLCELYCKSTDLQDGYWELSDELGQLLCFDIEKCKKLLIENGLHSLGSLGALEVTRIIAMCIIFYRIYEASESDEALSQVDAKKFKTWLNAIISGEESKHLPGDVDHLFRAAARFFARIDTKHPQLYQRFNLGRSWPAAALNLFGKGKTK